MPDTPLEKSPTLDQLRSWHRSQELPPVIDALSPNRSALSPPELTLLSLSMAMNGTPDQDLLQEAAAQTPDEADPLWLSDVALACLLCGQINKSLDLLEKALAHPDATAVEYGRMAAVYLTRGDLEKAAEFYQEAVDREPGNGIWHNNLAGILVRQQKLEQALENYDIALNLKPDLEQAKNSRLQVLRALERTEEVVQELEKQLEQDPENHPVRLRLVRAYEQDGNFTAAIQTIRDAVLPPEEVERPKEDIADEEKTDTPWAKQIGLRMELARLFTSRSMHWRVLHVLDQALKLEPENPTPCYAQQANALSELGKYDLALEKLDKAEKIVREGAQPEHEEKTNQEDEDHPVHQDTGSEDLDMEYPNLEADHDDQADDPQIKARLLPLDTTRASVLSEKGDYPEAEKILRRLLETYPGNAQLLTQLGQTLLWTGKLDEAADCFEEASNINPMALAQMVNARRLPEDPKALEKMRQMADNPLAPEPARITMSFALSDLYDKRKEPDNAWPYLELGNRLTDKQLGYKPEGFSKKVDIHKQVFSKEFFARQEPIGNSWPTPIFVVGMPRSGTTLTEQILCSHTDIFGAGELDLISRLTQLMPKVLKDKRPYPVCLDKLTPHLRTEAARFYLKGLQNYDTEHAYVVDKMPHNFMQLGLIALIFPKAKIIHVQRDPRDTAVSNFQQNFKAKHGGLGYAFDLEKTALQLNDYNRMMAHWREVLPIPMCEFRYEDLVSAQDEWSKKLLEFVGVEWDISVHDFHKTERAVRTASVSQVRQPIYQTSKQKWRKYEAYLQPLLDNLDPTYMPDVYKGS